MVFPASFSTEVVEYRVFVSLHLFQASHYERPLLRVSGSCINNMMLVCDAYAII